VHRSYIGKINLDEVEQEIASRTKEYGISRDEVGLLLSNTSAEHLGSDSKDIQAKIKNLGTVFQFDPATLPKTYRHYRGLAGAVVGELVEILQLSEEERARELKQNSRYQSLGGAFALNIDVLIGARLALSASA
jgi:hypothetical protein